MEFIRGESLEKRLETANAPLLEGQVLDWAVQVCEVLAYLHAQPRPIIFRDLKPSNIMVTEDGSIKLIDFGIARTYKAGQRKDTVTMGSENYAAPEQWGEAQTDPRADIYGLGATMYHLLANVPPLRPLCPPSGCPCGATTPPSSEGPPRPWRRPWIGPGRPLRQRRGDAGGALGLPAAARAPPGRGAPARPAASGRANARGARPRPGGQRRAGRRGKAAELAAPAPAGPEPFAAPPGPPRAGLTPRRLEAMPPGTACPACGAPNRGGARFCGHCGTRLGHQPQAVLTLVEPAPARWEYPLHRSVVLVGRRGGALPVDLDVGYDPEGYVSRNHARVMAFQGRYHVMDVGSANDTYVNGQRLEARRPRLLASGDRIRIGQVVLAFLIY